MLYATQRKIRTTKEQMNKIQHDGRILEITRDPPGQHSVYTRPGYNNSEIYRLTTFEKFPSSAIINPCHLAKNGFFYVGYKDRVKCFDCAQTIQDWTLGDDPLSTKWHRPHCQIVQRKFYTNIPIFTLCKGKPQSSLQTANPAGQKRPQSQDCQQPQDPISKTNFPLMFPCSNPINPHMRTLTARLLTFHDNTNKWPQERLAATPDDMAKAGLYYLGTNDCVKCWYCNGGLQNWDHTDEPWFEHAKWFPHCEFLLQNKGPEYIADITSCFKYLQRPKTPNPISLSARNLPSQSTDPLIIDPKQVDEIINLKTVTEMENSPLTPEAKLMGFTEKDIFSAFKQKLTNDGQTFKLLSTLVESLLNMQTEIENKDTKGKNQNPTTSSTLNHIQHRDTETLQTTDIPDFNTQYLCKLCFRDKASTVFLPCGHLATCRDCNNNTESCPICRKTIRERIYAYIV